MDEVSRAADVGAPLPARESRNRTLLAGLVLVVALGAGAWFAFRGSAGDGRVSASGAEVRIDSGGLRYIFQTIMGAEALYDLESDPRCLHNLLPERRADADRLRRNLAEKLEVEDLEKLRESRSDTIEALKRLGYL